MCLKELNSGKVPITMIKFTQCLDVLHNVSDVDERIQSLSQSEYMSEADNYPGTRRYEPPEFTDVKQRVSDVILENYPAIVEITSMSFSLQHQPEHLDMPGIIHRDPSVLNFVLYMDTEFQPHRGTTLYHNTYHRPITLEQDLLDATHLGQTSVSEHVLPYNQAFLDSEYCEFQPVYNSLALFPGYIMHGRNKNQSLPQLPRSFFVGFIRSAEVKIGTT
jgi:hypothetical protein